MGAGCWLLKATSGKGSLAAAAGGEEKGTGTSGHKDAVARPSALMTSSSSSLGSVGISLSSGPAWSSVWPPSGWI